MLWCVYIAHAVGIVRRYMTNPQIKNWEAIKWLLRYLRGTLSMSICFMKTSVPLQGFANADLAGDFDNRKSTSGYIFI